MLYSGKAMKKTSKLLPFAWVIRKRSIFSKRAAKEFDLFERTLRALVRHFGFQRVLRGLVDLACNESVRDVTSRRGRWTSEGRLYSEAFTLLDHAEKTLSTIARLERELAKAQGLTKEAPLASPAPARSTRRQPSRSADQDRRSRPRGKGSGRASSGRR